VEYFIILTVCVCYFVAFYVYSVTLSRLV